MTGLNIFRRTARGFCSGPLDVVFSDDEIVDQAFHYFRKIGFPYVVLPVHVCMQELNKLASSNNDSLLRTVVAYKVANSYHPHRFHGRYHTNKKSIYENFMDDDFLRSCLRRTLELKGIKALWIEGLAWHRVHMLSNFRPGFALFLYRRFCKPGAVVLDTSTGYGGRLVGFLASECGRYIGIDPNVDTYAGNLRMVKDFGREKDVELWNLPVEDVAVDEFRERCDFAFTSPPYFCTEVYSEAESQSCNRYIGGEDWKTGFLLPMMQLQYESLKPGSFSCVNIADVQIKSTLYPLVRWSIECALKAGFSHVGTKNYPMHHRLGHRKDPNLPVVEKREPVLIFRKE